MVLKFGIRRAYPERGGWDWAASLEGYTAIELAFHKPELFHSVRKQDVIGPLKERAIDVLSVHLPDQPVTRFGEFKSVFNKSLELALELDCHTLVVHPSYGSLDRVRREIERSIDPELERSDSYLCWETFESRRRILSGIEGIAAYCVQTARHRACYDFSHIIARPGMDINGTVLEQLERYASVIKVFHLSNQRQRDGNIELRHHPVWHPDCDIDFDSIFGLLKLRGAIVLEYLQQFHAQALGDVALVEKALVVT